MNDSTELFLLVLLAGAIRAAIPLVLAGLGELIYERSGVFNLGIEGIMLLGACSSVAAQLAGFPWWGSLCVGATAGTLGGLLHAILCVRLRTNQAVTGLALLFLFQGLTAVLGRELVGMPVKDTAVYPLSILSNVPVLGPILSRQDPVMLLAVLLAMLTWFILFRTRWGIVVRACGEKPEAAINAGISLIRVRLTTGCICGALGGLAGAQMALFSATQWQENMIAGRGWIAIVLVIFARWHPLLLILGALLFGGLNALQINLQATGWTVSSHLLGMLPFIITILVMALASWRLKKHPGWMPASLGKDPPPEVERTLIN